MGISASYVALKTFFPHKKLDSCAAQFLSNYRSGISRPELQRLFSASFGLDSGLFCQNDEIFGLTNDLMFSHYHNETFIKSTLLSFLSRGRKNAWAFEIPLPGCRVDFCRLGQAPIAYEIKTEFDSFDRLAHQIPGYQALFCEVYIVLPERRVADLPSTVPSNVGLITYQAENNRVSYRVARKASPSPENKGKLNEYLGSSLETYYSKWEFFAQHKKSLLEMDYQWVYRNRLLPAYRL